MRDRRRTVNLSSLGQLPVRLAIVVQRTMSNGRGYVGAGRRRRRVTLTRAPFRTARPRSRRRSAGRVRRPSEPQQARVRSGTREAIAEVRSVRANRTRSLDCAWAAEAAHPDCSGIGSISAVRIRAALPANRMARLKNMAPMPAAPATTPSAAGSTS